MRVLLRHMDTGFYYCGGYDWVDEVAGALDFGTVLKAATVALEQKLSKLTVVIRYDEPECEVALPLSVCI